MLQAPRGTEDILPNEQVYWQKIEKEFERIVSSLGFGKIATPFFEYKSVFERGVGAVTDVVEKQMFIVKRAGTFDELDTVEEELILRPEATAGIARSYVEHGMQTWPQPVKLYYFGPMFRYERPQKGRLRQHYQFGLEILGTNNPFTDAFLIGLVKTIYQEIGLSNFIFEINSIGCPNCRAKMKRAITNYYKPFKDLICSSCQNRLSKNPLRLLDCKQEKCQPFIANAPALIDYLCPSCKEHFKNTLEYLEDLNIPYDFNPRLVRGLDYYTKTIFEVVPQDKSAALGGGGRYDNLIELFGGSPTGAIGFAGGVERTILEMKKQGIRLEPTPKPDMILIHLGDSAKKKSLSLLFQLQKEGFKVSLSLEKESLKSQLNAANKLKIPLALILGQKETKEKTIIVRNMLDGAQETIPLKKLTNFLKAKLEVQS